MMKLLILLIAGVVVFGGTRSRENIVQRYLGFALATAGALFWAATFDAGAKGDANGTLYARVVLWSALGLLLSLGSLIASRLCGHKPMKVATTLLGACSAILCTINIIIPY
jgi:hypothetical protein